MADFGTITVVGIEVARVVGPQHGEIPVVDLGVESIAEYTIGGTAVLPTQFTGIPTTGQVWPRARTQVVDPTPPERQTVTFNTSVLASQNSELGSVALGKSFHILRISTSAPARVRLYTTVSARSNDLPRARGTNPDNEVDHGLILEFASASHILAADLSPAPIGHDGETYPDGTTPYTVANIGPADTAISVTLTYLPLAEWEE